MFCVFNNYVIIKGSICLWRDGDGIFRYINIRDLTLCCQNLIVVEKNSQVIFFSFFDLKYIGVALVHMMNRM